MVYTIGHSTRPIEEFLGLLAAHRIAQLVDVRRYPASRRHPQYAQAPLERSLRDVGIGYVHEVDLGGRRSPRGDSPNTGWRSASFRGYADHMDSEAFQLALTRIVDLARHSATAVMCAEAVPWRCHRQLIADALVARDREVRHILDHGAAGLHRLTPFARVLPGGRLVYPAIGEQARLPFADV